jgi:hypothetical protein
VQQYIPTEVEIEAIENWEMLTADRCQVNQIGTAVWHDEHGGDVAWRLMPGYREWADLFSTEKRIQLPLNSDHDDHINYTTEQSRHLVTYTHALTQSSRYRRTTSTRHWLP